MTAALAQPDARDFLVLIVDDEMFQLTLLAKTIAAMGFEKIVTARDGLDALEQISKGDVPDLVITDLQMPNIDGVEMLRQMGERGISPAVILVSAYDPNVLRAAETVSRTFDLRILGTIEKPVSRSALEPLLAQLGTPEQADAAGTLAVADGDDATDRMGAAELMAHIEAGDVLPYFQPKINLRSGRVAGAEALARLHGPGGTVIQPAAFIYLVEKDPAISICFTHAMAKVALSVLATLPENVRPPTLSVNLPAACLSADGIFERLRAASEEAGVAPQSIVWEVTEAAAIENFNLALQVLTRLRLFGFGLSLDDYGTGHSSLDRLASIPFSEVKIDRAFVRNCMAKPSSQKILKSTIAMVRDLGLVCVAEGAETEQDLAALKALGCDVVQGFAVSQPLASQAFADWLTQHANSLASNN